MHRLIRASIVCALGLLIAHSSETVRADVRLPHVFGEHMVLQRERPVPVWGWADAGEKVTVELAGQSAQTQAGADGRWKVRLPALPAGGPHELVVRAQNTVTLGDVLVGEVWLCSGQSNMEMGLGVVENGAAEVAAADLPEIRLFELPQVSAGTPADDVEASWRVCQPDTVAVGGWGGFSAVGYFFGRALHRELGVPIGLIDSSWGGTRIGPWTPGDAIAASETLGAVQTEISDALTAYRNALPASLEELEAWIAQTRAALANGQTELPPTPRWPRHPLDSRDRPTGLYNGMIHPLVPFGVRGAVWYQGEANVSLGEGLLYTERMKALIGGWRQAWGQGDFPFYYVQIAPFKYNWHQRDISPERVPQVWEAQTRALEISNTGMIVTTDIANLNDIHPANKRDVGERLARWALAKTYGRQDVVYSGPIYRSMEVVGRAVRIHFDYAEGGLDSRDGKALTWFQIAGADQRFQEARAQIEADGTLLVSSDTVPAPVAVRFGWHMEAEPNLINKAGLPASPFRTDDW